ncbi:ABC transporter ATP-binding protein [Candidatus Atelocyanobacterium thalassae]|uniref:Carbohydrate ABC transporter ATP-binding protein, CUT1 family n=2 Tax=Candidatus Atelocyanobacterium thalassae TaxID=713887 RepID=A0A086CI42_9CHRO|nr:ABC transporter ATP-binding protein [Candidatus Atelocyanobacterium thalassa]KFF41856.1 MAG: carbohydrate ABC transporter ATP-binding protein, CUT1 family [Candidatus Atelocyanobacterium thalassa isolate SIO64986]BDA40316.1 sn-glycerol-3-phosphate import ATP-binding protein UgpC [cyanobacterium endosymbiont of Braarudosphaera bigelowii]
MAKVILKNINKSFFRQRNKSKDSEVKILQHINLNVNDGEFMVLVGPSGCGKSTLLRLIAGLESITSGEVLIGEKNVSSLLPKQRDIAMVFQNYALYPHLNVYDNIAFGLRRINKIDQKIDKILDKVIRLLPRRFRYSSVLEIDINRQIEQVSKLLQLDGLLTRLPKQLSGGQRQRVALGRAIARNPKVFLMDEPMSNLDTILRTETRSQIVKLQNQLKITTIYVTHDQVEAMTMGDRIAVMNQGKIQQVASPLELYHHPVNCFVGSFIGSLPMNFLPATIKDSSKIFYDKFSLCIPLASRSYLKGYSKKFVILGFRPEHITLGVPHVSNLQVKVNLVENMGNEVHLFTETLSKNPIKIIVNYIGNNLIKKEDILWLSINKKTIHIFDSETEESLLK